MEKEFLTQIRRSVTLNVTGGKIDSFREKEETTGTVRAYDNGCIGIAGCLGEPDEQKLTEKAAEALALAGRGADGTRARAGGPDPLPPLPRRPPPGELCDVRPRNHPPRRVRSPDTPNGLPPL